MTDNITLSCLIYNDPIDQSFSIEIPQTSTVCNLKKLIKENRKHTFRDVDGDKLMLWKVDIPDDNEAIIKQLIFEDMIFGSTELLIGTRTIAEYFAVQPNKHCIHVIIKGPPGILYAFSWIFFRANSILT
jgi:hypothetical protein